MTQQTKRPNLLPYLLALLVLVGIYGFMSKPAEPEPSYAEVRELFAGVDFLHSERSYDLILEVTVDDRAALERYQKDPYHCGTVKAHMHAVREASVAVDVELPD